MARKQDSFGIFSGLFDAVTAFCLDQNAEQPRGIEQHMSRCDRHDDDFVGIKPHRFALAAQDADHPETPIAQPDPGTHTGFLAEQFAVNLCAQHADRFAGMHIPRWQKAPASQCHVAHGHEIRRRTQYNHFAVLCIL